MEILKKVITYKFTLECDIHEEINKVIIKEFEKGFKCLAYDFCIMKKEAEVIFVRNQTK